MKKNKTDSSAAKSAKTINPAEIEIREYAYHLYEKSGYIEGNEERNWEEAEIFLSSRSATKPPAVKNKKKAKKRPAAKRPNRRKVVKSTEAVT